MTRNAGRHFGTRATSRGLTNQPALSPDRLERLLHGDAPAPPAELSPGAIEARRLLDAANDAFTGKKKA